MSDIPIRIHLADGDFLLRLGIERIIEGLDYIDLESVSQTGEEAIASAVAMTPDIVLLEPGLRNVDGITAAREIDARVPSAKVVMLATSVDRDTMMRSFQAGATAYLTKCQVTEDLGPALRMIHRGSSILAMPPESVRVQLPQTIEHPQKSRLMAELSRRERQLLAGITEGATNAALALQLYRSEASIKADLTGLMARLGVANRVQLAVLGVRTGLVT